MAELEQKIKPTEQYKVNLVLTMNKDEYTQVQALIKTFGLKGVKNWAVREMVERSANINPPALE